MHTWSLVGNLINSSVVPSNSYTGVAGNDNIPLQPQCHSFQLAHKHAMDLHNVRRCMMLQMSCQKQHCFKKKKYNFISSCCQSKYKSRKDGDLLRSLYSRDETRQLRRAICRERESERWSVCHCWSTPASWEPGNQRIVVVT